jgi:glycerol-3-phosphate acyltransferase PlsY
MSLYWLFAFCTVAYFIGNISPAHMISKLLKTDVTKSGSGNPGTTNILRNFGTKWGAVCFILDGLKGAVPAMIAFFVYGGAVTLGSNSNPESSYIALFATGFAVVVGHTFPVLRKFRGGKGMAAMIGVFTVAHPWVSLAALAVLIICLFIFEYMPIGVFVYLTFMVSYAALQQINEYNIAVCALLFSFYFFILFTFRGNINRLLTGNEKPATLFKNLKQHRLRQRQAKWLKSLREQE